MSTRLALAFAALLIPAPCFAHLELGRYHGVAENGQPCSFKVTDVSFAFDLAHPLNERATIEALDTQLVLSHPPRVDVEASKIGFDHDHLSGTRGTRYGALAAIITMDHSAGHEGPTQLTLVHYNAKDANDTGKTVCSNLAHQEN